MVVLLVSSLLIILVAVYFWDFIIKQLPFVGIIFTLILGIVVFNAIALGLTFIFAKFVKKMKQEQAIGYVKELTLNFVILSIIPTILLTFLLQAILFKFGL